MLQGADFQAQNLAAQLPSLYGPLQSALTNLPDVGPLTDQLQSTLTNLPPIAGQTAPLQSALDRSAGIVSTGGAITGTEAADLNLNIGQQLGNLGMGRTNPGVFTQALNTYNEMQNRVNTAIGQELQLAPTIEGIAAKDAATRALIPQAIEQIRGQDIGLRTAVPQALQGLQTTAQGALTGAESAGIQGLTSLEGVTAGPISSQLLADQQAQAANVRAANNKNAGLESGAVQLGSAALLAA